MVNSNHCKAFLIFFISVNKKVDMMRNMAKICLIMFGN